MNLQLFDSLSTRALEHARAAIIVSDAIDPDFPIVYVNPSFETLTGYSSRDILGRNCRFLQGEDVDQPERHIIRKALNKRKPARAVLRNYRKNGELFYNELLIDPVCDANGAITHFVACQNEMPKPDQAHVLRKGYAGYDRLSERERDVFQRVVSGHTSKTIASELGISHRTVEKHRIAVFRKFEVSELTLLVRYAIALGVPFRSPR